MRQPGMLLYEGSQTFFRKEVERRELRSRISNMSAISATNTLSQSQLLTLTHPTSSGHALKEPQKSGAAKLLEKKQKMLEFQELLDEEKLISQKKVSLHLSMKAARHLISGRLERSLSSTGRVI